MAADGSAAPEREVRTHSLPARLRILLAAVLLLTILGLISAARLSGLKGKPATLPLLEYPELSEAVAEAVAAALHSAHPRPTIPRFYDPIVRSLASADGVHWRCGTLNVTGNGSAPQLIDVEARIPGVAHEALQAAGYIGDPLYRFNELAYRWVALAAWNFTATFAVAKDSLLLKPGPSGMPPELWLRLSGVDTFCTIFLNGVQLGSPLNSALMTHELPVLAGLLRPGSNSLVLAFSPSLAEAARRAAAYPYTVPHSVYHHTWSEPSHRNFVRKAQSDFGWDWGPSLIPTGLTGNIELRARWSNEVQLAGVAISQEHRESGAVALRVSGWLDTPIGSRPPMELYPSLELRLELCYPRCDGQPMQRMIGKGALTLPPGNDASAMRRDAAIPPLLVGSPRLWWPRGYGAPETYELLATLCLSPDAVGLGSNIDNSGSGDLQNLRSSGSRLPGNLGGANVGVPNCSAPLRRRVGLRRVELVQDAEPPPKSGAPNGTSFFFRLNGVPIFAKGANAIPSHVFASAEASAAGVAHWRWILRRAAAAHMNMVRVWGGGRYQPEAFYMACDEMGIMVWQEFVFACALYPRDRPFLELVRREVVEQTARLQTHSSVVIWGANNENEQALGWYEEARSNHDVYLVDEVKLYLDTVLPAVASADPDARPIVDSSPSNGVISSDPYVKRWGTASSSSWGDIHYYNYFSDCEDPDSYPAARFVSEHGFQSFPSFSQYSRVMSPEDWSRESPFAAFRMRHPDGNAQVLAMMRRHFRVPPASAGAGLAGNRSQARLFDDWLWLTQAQQARCYETAIHRWRRDRASNARTMGILYWQLNSIWQGPDWSTLEYDGTPRLAHHAVSRAFMPLLLSATVKLPPSLPPRIPSRGVAVLSGGASGSEVIDCAYPGEEYTKRHISPSQMRAAGLGSVSIAPQCCEPGNARGMTVDSCVRRLGGEINGRCTTSTDVLGPWGATFVEAASFCASHGLTLCERGCRGAGCDIDSMPVWSSLPCPNFSSGATATTLIVDAEAEVEAEFAAEAAAAAASLAPITVTAHIVSDLQITASGLLRIEAYRWADVPAVPLANKTARVIVGPSTSEAVWEGNVAPMLAGMALEHAFVRLLLEVDTPTADAMAAAKQHSSDHLETYIWLTPLRDAQLLRARPRLVSIEQLSPTIARLAVVSDITAVLFSAHCDEIEGAFSDGAITLLGGGQPMYIEFEATRPFEIEDLLSCLRLRSLSDTWE